MVVDEQLWAHAGAPCWRCSQATAWGCVASGCSTRVRGCGSGFANVFKPNVPGGRATAIHRIHGELTQIGMGPWYVWTAQRGFCYLTSGQETKWAKETGLNEQWYWQHCLPPLCIGTGMDRVGGQCHQHHPSLCPGSGLASTAASLTVRSGLPRYVGHREQGRYTARTRAM